MFVVSASRIELLRTIVTFHRRCNVSSLRNRFKEGYLDYVQTKPPKWMCSWSYLKIHSIRMMTSTPLKGIKDPQEIVLREQSKELLQKTREHVKEEKEKKREELHFTTTWRGFVVYWFRIAKEVGWNFWYGTKDLYYNTRQTQKLIQMRRQGIVLNRSQERFIRQNRKDLKNLIPFFLVWRIPIFGDFILPFFVAKFPDLLPSTYNLVRKPTLEEVVKLSKIKQLSMIHLDHAKTRDTSMDSTLEEMRCSLRDAYHLPLSCKRLLENKDLLMKKIPPVEQLTRRQIAAVCAVLNLGTRNFTFFLRKKFCSHMEYLSNDDKMIHQEGIDQLDDLDLKMANIERGLAVLGTTRKQLEVQLTEWICITLADPQLKTPLLIYCHAFHQRDLLLAPDLDSKQ